MQIISLKNRRKAFSEAVKVLLGGGIIAHPTDTCYGFAAMITSEEAVKKLYQLKKMDCVKPVSILVSSLKEARKYGVLSKVAEKLAKKFWPGPLTIVVKRKKSLPKFLNPHIDTIGIRVPDDKFSRALVEKLKAPVTTTSANITDKRSPYSINEIIRQFKNQKVKPDLLIDGGKLNPKNPPSTVLDTTKKELFYIRKGEIRIPTDSIEASEADPKIE